MADTRQGGPPSGVGGPDTVSDGPSDESGGSLLTNPAASGELEGDIVCHSLTSQTFVKGQTLQVTAAASIGDNLTAKTLTAVQGISGDSIQIATTADITGNLTANNLKAIAGITGDTLITTGAASVGGALDALTLTAVGAIAGNDLETAHGAVIGDGIEVGTNAVVSGNVVVGGTLYTGNDTLIIPAASFIQTLVPGGGVFGNAGVWGTTAAGVILMSPTGLWEGRRITTIEWHYNRGGVGAGTITLELVREANGGVPVVIDTFADNTSSGWTSETRTVNYTLGSNPGSQVYLQSTMTANSNLLGYAIINSDRLAP